MAKQKEVTPLFNNPVDVLLSKGRGVTAAARRDLNLPGNKGLADYGYTSARLQTIDALGDAVSDIATDDEYLGVLIEKTKIKDDLAAEVRALVGDVVARASSFYGEDSGKVRRYGTHKLSKLTDGQLWQCAKRVWRVGNAQLADLAARGLTQAHLDTLKARYEAFDLARDDQDDAIRERDLATQERIVAANAYYKALLPLLADGKAKFESTDEARYNDYVWDPAPESGDGGQTPGPPK